MRPAISDLWYLEETADKIIVRTAIPIEITEYVPANKDFEIYGDVLTLSSSITIPGKKLSIVCRVLNCKSSPTIDVSGGLPKKNYSPGDKPQTPSQVPVGIGTPGTRGDDGDPGGDGGNIYIAAHQIIGDLNLIANGHIGGRAQDGGDGGIGPEGPIGEQNHAGEIYGGAGGIGYKGGPAGHSGKSGRGGNGGFVFVRAVGALPRIAASAAMGIHGPLAVHGDGGEGGPGGFGGLRYTCRVQLHGPPAGPHFILRHLRLVQEEGQSEAADWSGRNGEAAAVRAREAITAQSVSLLASSPYEFRGLDCHANPWGERAPSGPQGPKGDRIDERIDPPLSDPDGTDGQVDIQQGGIAHLTALFCPGALALIQLNAAKAFRDIAQSYETVATIFNWIAEISTDQNVQAAQQIRHTLGLPALNLQEIAQYATMYSKCTTRLAQMAAGLDYYGLPRNYIPIPNIEPYKNLFVSLASTAQAIEDAYDRYTGQIVDAHDRVEKLRTAISEYDGLQEQTDREIASSKDDLKAIDDQIQNFYLDVHSKKKC